ncbi:MAG: hypothetical protein GXP34_09595 [Actinobacteria bacterium]|nr:hypothetical protein [Actinomycetota bacterium]
MRHLRRLVAPTLVLLFVLGVSAGAAADVQILRSDDAAYVTDLEGQGLANGRLPDEALVEVDGSQSLCLLEADAASRWLQLVADAAADGVQIEAAWCYRSLASQRQTYIRNCGSLHAPPSACNKATATPGRSNHGWGRAIDVTSNGRQVNCRSEAFRWLTEHGAEHGWVLPFWAVCGGDTPEPWHWEWGGIDEPPVFPVGMRPV